MVPPTQSIIVASISLCCVPKIFFCYLSVDYIESQVNLITSRKYTVSNATNVFNWISIPRGFLSMLETQYLIGHEWPFCHYVIHINIIQLTPLGVFSGRFHPVPELPISLIKLSIFTVFLIIFLTIDTYLPCQLSLWEETGEPGENPTLSAKCDELFPRTIRCSIQGSNPWPQWWEDVA